MLTAVFMILALALGVAAGELKPGAPAPAKPAEPTCHIDIPEI